MNCRERERETEMCVNYLLHLCNNKAIINNLKNSDVTTLLLSKGKWGNNDNKCLCS